MKKSLIILSLIIFVFLVILGVSLRRRPHNLISYSNLKQELTIVHQSSQNVAIHLLHQLSTSSIEDIQIAQIEMTVKNLNMMLQDISTNFTQFSPFYQRQKQRDFFHQIEINNLILIQIDKSLHNIKDGNQLQALNHLKKILNENLLTDI